METSADRLASTPRLDLYAFVHKGLRAFMSATLSAVGRMDPDDEADRAAAMSQLRELLTTCADHLAHENEFVHTAMETKRPGTAARAAADHVGHLREIAALSASIDEFESAAGPARAAAAQRLYRQLALFVAENFEHMNVEETAHNAVLWAAYSDQQLAELHDALVASIPPPALAGIMRWIIPSVSHPERVIVLSDIRRNAPAEAFAGMMALARAHLSERDWDKLTRALEVGTAAAA